MIGVVIVTHGNLGKEFLETASFIVGDIPAATWVAVQASESADDIHDHLLDAINRVETDDDDDGVIIFTDMFGGTPSNVALSLLGERNIEVITGVNMPMLMEIPNIRRGELSLYEAASALSKAGKKNILSVSDLFGSNKNGK